jgi:hypothetical protein
MYYKTGTDLAASFIIVLYRLSVSQQRSYCSLSELFQKIKSGIMASYQVIGIRKPGINSTAEEITHIAYVSPVFNERTVIPVATAILRIDENPKEFFVRFSKNTDYLEVVRPEQGAAAIRTKLVSKKDNLLRLQSC